MKLVISIDVEEEGLFCRRYSRRPPGVENVAHLRRIEPISRELGVPLTLLVTHPVACSASCQRALRFWRDELQAELGAHLHPWNTPPFHEMAHPEPVPSDILPASVLSAKLESLVTALRRNLDVVPRAFRMGRFDFGAQVASLLPRYGFQIDSSVVPLRTVDGVDHFRAPRDPYWLHPSGEESLVLEVPLTMIPVSESIARTVYRMARSLPTRKGVLLLSAFRHLAVLGIHPAWHPLDSMKWAVRLHRRRGGRVLHMFLHSSELAPGATPQFPSEAAVRRLVGKLGAFLSWLLRTGPVEPVRLSDLYSDQGHSNLCRGAPG
ncbi:MAG: hypothetical protein AB9873_18655 [Syntrophobacteraceae bacterium]